MATTSIMNQQASIIAKLNAVQAELNANTDSIIRAQLYVDLVDLLTQVGRHTHTYTDQYFIATGNTHPIATTSYTKTTSQLLTTL
jgi:hypothetical protein